jgi:GT2 family glycosyltransferase
MKVAIIFPICIQNTRIQHLFLENLTTYSSRKVELEFFLVCNRLTTMDGPMLQERAYQEVSGPKVTVVHDRERSVAGAWNHGIKLAQQEGIKHFIFSSQDVAFHPKTIDNYIGVQETFDAQLVGGVDNHREEPGVVWDSVDFPSFMITQETVDKHGWFDREYKPAYFEDNDYDTRVRLGKGKLISAESIRYYHLRSSTVGLDPEMAHHVNHWFGNNAARFGAKFGMGVGDWTSPNRTSTPFGEPDKPWSWWPEQDREGYIVDGGTHD